MTTLDQVTAGAGADTVVNQANEAMSPAAAFGIRKSTTSGLTFGYYGGTLDGANYSNGTHALTASTTRYVVVARATGVVSSATSTTNWNDTTNYLRMGVAVVGASTITTWTDWRQGYGGAGGGGGGGMTNPMTTAGDIITGGSSGTPQRLAAGTNGYVLTMVSGAPAWVADASGAPVQCIPIACSDETTGLTAGTAKVTFRMPYAFTLTAVRASLTTAATGGTLLTVDINEGGTTILSTKLTIDASEKTSTTAATAAVISDSSLADDAEITIDIDSVGSSTPGAGLKVYLIGTKT